MLPLKPCRIRLHPTIFYKMALIKNDIEYQEKWAQLQRLYTAISVQFKKTDITETSAAQFVKFAARIMDTAAIVLGEIEEYTGAAEFRRLDYAMRDIRDKRERAERGGDSVQ